MNTAHGVSNSPEDLQYKFSPVFYDELSWLFSPSSELYDQKAETVRIDTNSLTVYLK